MEHYKPHSLAAFEGYYTRIQLRSGSSLIYVICTIPKANGHPRAHQASLTYVSANGHIWQQQCWPSEMRFLALDDGSDNGFSLVGREGHEAGEEYCLTASIDRTSIVHKNAEVRFTAHLGERTPWSTHTSNSSPESWLSLLPLPLHWHVYSLQSPCTVQLSLPSAAKLDPQDAGATVTGIAHQEKNWANSFPSAHMWLHARQDSTDDDAGIKKRTARGLVLAGGRILGMDAFLIGYRNEDNGIELDFRPPCALRILGGIFGPFMHFNVDWESRTFSLTVRGLLWKLVVKGHAPKGTFYPLSAPYATGHKENWLAQSLQANIQVEVWKKAGAVGWLGSVQACVLGDWEIVCKDQFERGALEFGGEYYPLRGTDKKRN